MPRLSSTYRNQVIAWRKRRSDHTWGPKQDVVAVLIQRYGGERVLRHLDQISRAMDAIDKAAANGHTDRAAG